jgi:hypothetical protein
MENTIEAGTRILMARLQNENGYLDLCIKDEDRICAIMPLMFTCAIIADLDAYTIGDRWCYKNYKDAKAAFDAWDGKGEPTGWHRHPKTGRRLDENGNPYVMY